MRASLTATYYSCTHELHARCGFEPGECVQIWIDSCPLLGRKYPWWIRDATDAFGSVRAGEGDVEQLKETQPW